ncbi:MAG: Crp/Fnr family transcriptional regulator [Pseudomonadota bacterium]
MEWTDFLIEQFASPGKLVGHLSYVLLVLSMMMRSMTWLRIVAVSAGVTSAFYGYFFLRDFVTVFWEIIFVTVNLLQLLILEFENRRARFSADEQKFIKATVPKVERAHAKRLLKIAKLCDLAPGAVLTEEGKPVTALTFIVEGAASIEKGGAMVGVCGHDDFVGEIGFMTGSPATATATVTHSVRGFSFEPEKLRTLLDKEPSLQQAMESSFNRNLVGKLVKSNEGQGATMERALEA